MNPIEKIKQEHEDIERELLELETISQEAIINYPNLLHVFNKLHDAWNQHENQKNNGPPHPKGFLLRQKIACWRVWFDWPLFLGPQKRKFLMALKVPRTLTCSRIENCNISYDHMINHVVFNS